MIKLIIFDFGKVLGSGADPWNEELKVMQNITGLTILQLDKIFEKHWPQIKVGKKPLTNFFQEVSKKSKKPIAGEFIDIKYNVPSGDYFDNPKKKNGEFKVPYLRFINDTTLQRFDNGFVVFTREAFLPKKQEIDSRTK